MLIHRTGGRMPVVKQYCHRGFGHHAGLDRVTIFVLLVKFNVEILVKLGKAVIVNGKLDWLGIPLISAGETERAVIGAVIGAGSAKIKVWNQAINGSAVSGIRRGVIGTRLQGGVDI